VLFICECPFIIAITTMYGPGPATLFFAAIAVAYAQTASLSAPPQTLSPAESSIIPLSLSSGGQEIAALQFDLQWDPVLTLNFTLGDQARAAGKSPYCVAISPGVIRCLILGVNQTAIADGEVLKMFLLANSTVPNGSASLAITNAIASAPDGSQVLLAASPVTVRIQSGSGTAAATLSTAAILNAATLLPGPISPGEIVTLLGVNGSGGPSLTVGGVPASLLYAGPGQINAVVPFGLDVASQAAIRLQIGGLTLSATSPVSATSPGIFAANGSGFGPGAILNEDSSINSPDNPAKAGSIVVLYGTGFGVLQSPLLDGQPIPAANSTVNPVTATVAGFPAEVLYAGAAPQLIAGAIQVNLRLPSGVVHDLYVPVTVSAGGSKSSSTVTLAVQ
jgi:uncharacterized protein (TIGR03437 family)